VLQIGEVLKPTCCTVLSPLCFLRRESELRRVGEELAGWEGEDDGDEEEDGRNAGEEGIPLRPVLLPLPPSLP